MKVIILSGPSGCGKTTWSKTQYPEALICSADHFFMKDGEYNFDPSKLGEAHAYCFAGFLNALHDEAEVIVVDNTNIHHWERMNYIRAARFAGYEVHLHVWPVTTISELKTCFSRTQHGVPPEVIARMAWEHTVEPGSFAHAIE